MKEQYQRPDLESQFVGFSERVRPDVQLATQRAYERGVLLVRDLRIQIPQSLDDWRERSKGEYRSNPLLADPRLSLHRTPQIKDIKKIPPHVNEVFEKYIEAGSIKEERI